MNKGIHIVSSAEACCLVGLGPVDMVRWSVPLSCGCRVQDALFREAGCGSDCQELRPELPQLLGLS